MTVGIVGIGYVGLPLAVAFAEAGTPAIGVDVDFERVKALRAGSSPIEDIPDEQLQAVAHRLSFETNYGALRDADAVLLCVPTPLTPQREPDLTSLMSATEALAGVLCEGQLVVLESTTYPGTTREHLLPALEESGLKAGEGFNLAYSPERVDPGSPEHSIQNTPKIVGGLTPACAERAEALYSTICDEIVHVSSPEAAELAKLLENIFRSVNIALVNELAVLTHRMGIDIWEVIGAAATKPFGFMRFDPGPGMGGHCLPVDPFYLSWKAREYDFPAEFIELAGRSTRRSPTSSSSWSSRPSTTPDARSSRPASSSSASPTSRGWGTFGNRRRSSSSSSCGATAPRSPTTTPSCPSCPSSGCTARSWTARWPSRTSS
jgi:UDP-N-acetyl-D-glucosamine dehydrogenase